MPPDETARPFDARCVLRRGARTRRPRARATRVLGGAWLASVLIACPLALASAALAADGGPSLNIPVPASARVGQTASTATPATPTTATAAPRSTPSGAATTPAGGVAQSPPGLAGALGLAPRTAKPAARPARRHGRGISDAAIVAASVAALIALCCAVWAVARMRAIEPRWTLSLRHALAEAGYRASATWAELGDWARLGR